MNRLKEAIVSTIASDPEVSAPGQISADFFFSSDFIGFAGHFDQDPVLPAFVQIMAAQTLVERIHSISMKLESIQTAKFKRPIPPETLVRIECEQNVPSEPWQCRLWAANQLAASFQMKLSPDVEVSGGSPR